MTRRADIQGLRGLAVLLVVFYHAHLPGLSGGYVGVDVFFVISGYLISGLLVDEFERTGRITLLPFYARRVRRLLPASAVLVVTVLAVGWWSYPAVERHGLNAAAAATAAYVSNIWFARASTNYFAADLAPNPLLHTWSLGVEEQFYFVWPLLMVAIARFGSEGFRRRLGVAMVSMIVGSFALCVLLTVRHQPWAFFFSPTRAWEFGLGALARLHHAPVVRTVSAYPAIGFAGFVTMVGSAFVYDDSTAFPGWAAVAPALGTAIVLIAGEAAPTSLMPRLLGQRALSHVGDVSYSWYLWHWPIFAFLEWEMGAPPGIWMATALVGSWLMAELTFRVVEEPVRHHQTLARSPRVSLALAAIVSLITGGVAIVANRGSEATESAGASETPAAPRIYDDGCHADFPVSSSPPCTYGHVGAPTTVFLVGDSHAAQWFPALERMAAENGWQLVSTTKSSCPVTDVQVVLPQLRRVYVECQRWRDDVLQRVVAARPALVVLGHSSRYVQEGVPESVFGVAASAWRAGLERTLDRLSRAGAAVAVLHDTPWAERRLPECVSRARWRSGDPNVSCAFSTVDADRTLQTRLSSEALDGRPWARGVDLSAVVCPDEPCRPTRGETVLFSDSNHLSAPVSLSLAGAVERELRAALPQLPWRESPMVAAKNE